MKSEIRWLRDAVARKAIAEHMTYYAFSRESIQATDGRVTASIPFASGISALVPGAALEAALNAAPEGAPLKLSHQGDKVTITAAKFRATIDTRDRAEWSASAPQGEREEAPVALIEAASGLLPFLSTDMSTRPWMTGVGVRENYAYATNSRVLVRTREALGEGLPDIVLPRWAVEFLADRADGLAQWSLNTNHMGAYWKNGAWCRAQLVDGTYAKVEPILAPAVESTQYKKIDPALRDALSRACAVADGAIILSENRVEVHDASVNLDLEAPLDAPFEHTWPKVELKNALAVAEEFDFHSMPGRLFFRSSSIVGVMSSFDPPAA